MPVNVLAVSQLGSLKTDSLRDLRKTQEKEQKKIQTWANERPGCSLALNVAFWEIGAGCLRSLSAKTTALSAPSSIFRLLRWSKCFLGVGIGGDWNKNLNWWFLTISKSSHFWVSVPNVWSCMGYWSLNLAAHTETVLMSEEEILSKQFYSHLENAEKNIKKDPWWPNGWGLLT